MKYTPATKELLSKIKENMADPKGTTTPLAFWLQTKEYQRITKRYYKFLYPKGLRSCRLSNFEQLDSSQPTISDFQL